jgi:ribonuclease HI
MMPEVTIYSDGGADPNPGIGGWAAILLYDGHEKVLTGNSEHSTNNRMELTAAIAALQALKRPCQVQFYTDSEYLRRGITEWIDAWAERNWVHKGGKPVSNADLWRTLWPLTKEHQITWHWVRGHSGDQFNERVDELARAARMAITPEAQVSANAPRLYLRASCRGNPGPGGWGVVLEEDDDTVQVSGSQPETTNNRMELRAAVEGLSLLPPGSMLQAFTTSDYLYQGATRWIHGWRQREWRKRDGKPVANSDLWQELDSLMRERQVRWINAKGEREEGSKGLAEAAKLAANAIEIV